MSSRDGRTFTFMVEPAGAPAPRPGDVVAIRAPGMATFLGQVLQSEEDGPTTRGSGRLIGVYDTDGEVDLRGRRPFPEGSLVPGTADHLEALQRAASADLPIGSWTSSGVSVAARLRAQGFGRHTFLCGQSGSGKTYALGVILEQILLGTDLRMVVMDPNSDFVRLGETRPGAPEDAARRIANSKITVLSAGAAGGRPLRLRFATMPRQAQAAVLRLDPLADREEYNIFLHRMAERSFADVVGLVHLLDRGGDEERALAQRIENLGFLDWEVWAGEQASAAEVVAEGSRLTVMDLSGFRDPHEPIAVALDLVERLWEQRATRTPTLLVIDEAHNICPAEPVGPVQQAVVDRLIQIAAEGRKYGLWLLLSTQRPSKIHPQVLSQCDNLALMRMNSPGDVAQLVEVFGFAPEALLRLSPFFDQGETLMAGAFVPVPSIMRMGDRLTYEGGSDVAVPRA